MTEYHLVSTAVKAPSIHIILKCITRQVVVATPLIPALRGQRQEDVCEFEAGLVYRLSSRTSRAVVTHKLSSS